MTSTLRSWPAAVFSWPSCIQFIIGPGCFFKLRFYDFAIRNYVLKRQIMISTANVKVVNVMCSTIYLSVVSCHHVICS